MSWVDLGPADLDDGGLREAVAGDLHLGVARQGGAWHAFETWCTHAECPLTDGWLEGGAIRCACHGALFALATGEPLEGPAEAAIRVFPVREADGRLSADLPMLSS